MEWFDVAGTGTLLTYSTLSYAPTGFGQDLPYTIAVVDFGSVRVFGRLDRSLTAENILIGMRLKPEVLKLPDGNLAYEFRVVS